MSFFLAQRWRRQPTSPAQIDFRHPLARDLRFFVTNVGGGFREQVRMANVTCNGAARGSGFSRLGQSSTAAALSSGSLDYLSVADDASYSILGDLTLFWSGHIVTGGNYRHFAGKHTGSGATNCQFDFRTDNSAAPLIVLLRSNASASVTATSVSSLPLKTPITVGVTSLSGTNSAVLYNNGIAEAFVAAGSWSPTTNTAALQIGRRADGAVQMDGKTEFVAGWARVLSPDEARAFHYDPWQIFMPRTRRLYFSPTISAGGGFFARDYYDMIGKAA